MFQSLFKVLHIYQLTVFTITLNAGHYYDHHFALEDQVQRSEL